MDEREKNERIKRDDTQETPPHGDPIRTRDRTSRQGEVEAEPEPESDLADESVGADRDGKATGQL